MRQGFADKHTAQRVARAILDATGETVAERTVSRRQAEWQAEKSAYDSMRQKMEMLRTLGADGVEIMQACMQDYLFEHPDALENCDPIKIFGASAKAEQLAQKKREISLRERAQTVNEQTLAMAQRKLAMLEAREQRALDALLQEQGSGITPEMRAEKVRQILGLTA
jgi:hypothetical protein